MIAEQWLIVFKDGFPPEWQPLYSSVWNVSSRVLGEIVLNFPLKEPQTWSLSAVMLELLLPNVGVTLVDICSWWTCTSQTLQLSVLSLKSCKIVKENTFVTDCSVTLMTLTLKLSLFYFFFTFFYTFWVPLVQARKPEYSEHICWWNFIYIEFNANVKWNYISHIQIFLWIELIILV